MSNLIAPPVLRHVGVAAVGLTAVFSPSQAKAHETQTLECLCDALPFLDTAPAA